MADKRTAAEVAEQVSRRRSRALWVSGTFFTVWQVAFATSGQGDLPPVRLVDQVKLGGWVAWVLVLLGMLATGGVVLRSAEVQRRVNDEVSVANRLAGQRAGFWVAVLTMIGLYVATFFVSLSVHEVLHIVLTVAVGGALLRYAILERRAERGG